jgi:GTP1/Obg family GTP-binding protein
MNAIVWVVDASGECGEDLLVTSCSQLHLLLQEESLRCVPLLVVSTKMDCLVGRSADEIKMALHLDLIDDRAWTVCACSAATGEGISHVLQWLVNNYRK